VCIGSGGRESMDVGGGTPANTSADSSVSGAECGSASPTVGSVPTRRSGSGESPLRRSSRSGRGPSVSFAMLAADSLDISDGEDRASKRRRRKAVHKSEPGLRCRGCSLGLCAPCS
jgi:hypothetical protein